MNNIKNNKKENTSVLLYVAEDGKTEIEVNLEGETVWLSQKQMAELFQKTVPTINEHIKNVFLEGELMENSVIRKFRITAADGKSYETNYYNLDVIISVGYRVKSHRGTQFRIWATQKLRVLSMWMCIQSMNISKISINQVNCGSLQLSGISG